MVLWFGLFRFVGQLDLLHVQVEHLVEQSRDPTRQLSGELWRHHDVACRLDLVLLDERSEDDRHWQVAEEPYKPDGLLLVDQPFPYVGDVLVPFWLLGDEIS